MEPAIILARTERQAMDWGLVLASQEIPAKIQNFDEAGWALVVDSGDHGRALEAIRLYREENRKWHWRQPVAWSEAGFHWGALAWSCWLAFVYQASTMVYPDLVPAARMDSMAVWGGAWWRLFTAVWLHGDLPHLFANITTGLLLLGLAMARFGAGAALFAAYVSGALGNVCGLLLYQKAYFGLGASGMVMGALGLISAQGLVSLRQHPAAFRHIARALLAGALIFVLLGLNPASDVVAHLGGFAGGLIIGSLMASAADKIERSLTTQKFGMILLVLLVLLPGWLAWMHRP